MSSTELPTLRSTLQELQSCELPTNYQQLEKENNTNSSNTEPLLFYNPELLQQYKTLRNTYIQQATIDKFLSSLQEYNPENNTFPLPTNQQTVEEKEELVQRQNEVLNKVQQTIKQVNGDMDSIRLKWEQFVNKREEFAQIVDQLENQNRNRRLEGNNNGDGMEEDNTMDEDNGEEITEDDVAMEEEKLDELQQRKIELEKRLRSVRAQILDVEDDCHRTKRVVNEVRVKSGRKPLDWRGLTVVRRVVIIIIRRVQVKTVSQQLPMELRVKLQSWKKKLQSLRNHVNFMMVFVN